MRFTTLSMLCVLAVAAACSGSDAGTQNSSRNAAASAGASSIPDDNTILALAYDPNYHVPDGFFVDERAETTTRSYSLHHVLDASKSYERCTNDLVTAQAWEQADNAARAVSGYYVTSIENERYFEFVRELDYTQAVGNVGDPTSPGYARVFKCDYADRSGVDRNLRDGYSGRLTVEPPNSDSLREFVEYLWQFRFFNVSRKAVIASDGTQDATGLTHTLLLALVVSQGSAHCDRVDVVEWRFRFDTSAAEIRREFHTIRSFEARAINGEAQRCD